MIFIKSIMYKINFSILVIFVWTGLGVFAQSSKNASVLKNSLLKGKVIYQQNCLSCHQEDGSGVSRLNPPLIKTSFVLGDQAKLIKIVLNGLEEEIEINGEYYSNPMPAFGSTLKDQEIADVLTYIRNNFGNKASAVTVATVKTVRATVK